MTAVTMAQPGFIEGPWQRLQESIVISVPASGTLTYFKYFTGLKIQQEDVLRFGGGGMLFGAYDTSAKLQLVTQSVYIQMQNNGQYVLPLYPPTQLPFPADTYLNNAYLVATLPPIEVPGEALGGGGWPTQFLAVNVSVHNTDTAAHSYYLSYSLPYQIVSRKRAV